MKRSFGAALLLAGVSAVALVGCSDDDRAYPEQVRNNFLTACSETSGGETSACECMLENIEARVSLTEFMAVEANYMETGVMPDKIMDAMTSCV